MEHGRQEQRMASRQLTEDQQKKIALDLFLDAWDKSCEHGVSADMLAEVLIYLALTDLVVDRGEDWTAEVVSELPDRIRNGEFTLDEGQTEA